MLGARPQETAVPARSDSVPSEQMGVDAEQLDSVGSEHSLPEKETALAVLEKMMLIRRFEERAGEMYAKAKIGGFLHLCIGEEATIVGAVNAMRDEDYLMSTYREHGQALARGTHPNNVMAELFGRVDGVSKGRGGSMHLFDFERRFLGGYGIVGGNLPLATGVALACDYMDTEDAIVCMFGDGASNQGTFGESMNLAALWKLPVVFMVINNQFGMGTSLERHSAVTDRFRGHSMADPEEYRSKEEVEEWRKRDPINVFKARLVDEDVISDDDF